MSAVSGAVERYLETIHELEPEGPVRVKDIAVALSISYPSVTGMVNRLVESGLATHDRYRHIELTSKGRRIARGLDRKQAVIMRFFTEVLGIDEEAAERDACEIEHVISTGTLDKLVEYLEKTTRPAG